MPKIDFGKPDEGMNPTIKGLTYEDRMKRVMNEWQLCPKCKGEGFYERIITGRPGYNAICDVCNGKKIISKVNGLPPQ